MQYLGKNSIEWPHFWLYDSVFYIRDWNCYPQCLLSPIIHLSMRNPTGMFLKKSFVILNHFRWQICKNCIALTIQLMYQWLLNFEWLPIEYTWQWIGLLMTSGAIKSEWKDSEYADAQREITCKTGRMAHKIRNWNKVKNTIILNKLLITEVKCFTFFTNWHICCHKSSVLYVKEVLKTCFILF